MKKLALMVGLAGSIGFLAPSLDAGAQEYRTQPRDYQPGAQPRSYQEGQQREYQQAEPRRMDREARAGWRTRDEMLADWITIRLAESPSLAPARIRVSVDQGIVTLRGYVPNQQVEQRALRIARGAEGVRGVRDMIEVNRELERYRPVAVDDGTLARRVAQRIANNVFPGATAREDWFAGWEVEGPGGEWDFDVEVDEGRVALDGDVPSARAIRQVVMAARAVPGVISIESNLEVNGVDPFERRGWMGAEEPYGYEPDGRPDWDWGQ